MLTHDICRDAIQSWGDIYNDEYTHFTPEKQRR